MLKSGIKDENIINLEKFITEYMKNLGLDIVNLVIKKEVSDLDKGFIKSCIEQKEYSLASRFLMDIYRMEKEDAIIFVFKIFKEMREDDV